MSFTALSHSFRMGVSTISTLVHETCMAIWNELVGIHMPPPTEQQLKMVAEDYYRLWNFANCIGSLDGKHCRIKKKQKNSGSLDLFIIFFIR